MKNIFKAILITVVLLALCPAAQAAMYYVDFGSGKDSNDGGKDTNNGTSPATTWKHCPGDVNATGNAKTATLQPADTIIFKGGVRYLGTINIKWSGEAGKPITYDGNSAGAFGTGKAIIDGEGEELGINARQYGFVNNGAIINNNRVAFSHLVINNFEIRNLRYIYEDAPGFEPIAITMGSNAGTDIEVKNNYIHQVKKKTIAVDFEKDAAGVTSRQINENYAQKTTTAAHTIAPTATTLSDSGEDFGAYAGIPGSLAAYKIAVGWGNSDYNRAWGYLGELSGGATSIKVYKDIYLRTPGWNQVDPIGQSGYFYFIQSMQGGSTMLGGGLGISISGISNVSIHDNVVKEAALDIRVDARQDPVEKVSIFNNDISDSISALRVSTGGMAPASTLNVDIHNNSLHDLLDYSYYDWGRHDDGIFISDAASRATRYDPVAGRYLVAIDGIQIHDNFFYGRFRGSAMSALIYVSGSARNLKISNNVFAPSTGASYLIRGVGYQDGPPPSGVDVVQIYNNTFFGIPGNMANPMLFDGTGNISLRNNVFYLFENVGAIIDVDSWGIANFSSDYNLLFGARPVSGQQNSGEFMFPHRPDPKDNTYYSIEEWQAAAFPFPHDQHSVVRQDPLFKNAPKFAAKTTGSGDTQRIYLAANTNPKYDHTFAVGDNIQYSYDVDDLPRQVTAVGSDYIEINPPLLRNPRPAEIVLDWKSATSFVYDLSPAAGSPLIDAGTNLSAQIESFDFKGTPRPQGPQWAIGAYEYVEGGTAIIYGDVSNDGTISAYDAALAAQYAVGLITLTPEQITRADVSGGGGVSAYDAALIAQRAVGLISKFPVE